MQPRSGGSSVVQELEIWVNTDNSASESEIECRDCLEISVGRNETQVTAVHSEDSGTIREKIILKRNSSGDSGTHKLSTGGETDTIRNKRDAESDEEDKQSDWHPFKKQTLQHKAIKTKHEIKDLKDFKPSKKYEEASQENDFLPIVWTIEQPKSLEASESKSEEDITSREDSLPHYYSYPYKEDIDRIKYDEQPKVNDQVYSIHGYKMGSKVPAYKWANYQKQQPKSQLSSLLDSDLLGKRKPYFDSGYGSLGLSRFRTYKSPFHKFYKDSLSSFGSVKLDRIPSTRVLSEKIRTNRPSTDKSVPLLSPIRISNTPAPKSPDLDPDFFSPEVVKHLDQMLKEKGPEMDQALKSPLKNSQSYSNPLKPRSKYSFKYDRVKYVL